MSVPFYLSLAIYQLCSIIAASVLPFFILSCLLGVSHLPWRLGGKFIMQYLNKVIYCVRYFISTAEVSLKGHFLSLYFGGSFF